MTERQSIKVEIDAGELVGSQAWTALRRDVDEHGAKGIGDGFGMLAVRVNDHAAVLLFVHEDKAGHAVIDVTDAFTKKKLGTVDIELYGAAPVRRGSRKKRDRRFGDEPVQQQH